MSAPPATIVIPVHRQRDDWLEQSVRSAIGQTVPAEVVVVTAADTPDSNLAVLERLGSMAGARMLVVQRPRPGFAVALNEGIRRARAGRVGFLFSDDWLAPDAVEQAALVPADIVSTGKRIWAVEPDGEQRLIHEAAMSSAAYEKLGTLEERARYITHFLLLRRAAVLAAGGVDESLGDLSGVDDFDLIWTMLERGASVGFTAAPAYDVRDHAGHRLTLRPTAEQSLSLERMFDKHGVDPATRDRLRPQHQRWYGRRLEDVLIEESGRGG